MNQASLFFRVFDLAFFAPGLVVLLPVWLVLRGIGASNALDVNGVMAIGAWILMAYAVGLTVHGLGRLLGGVERIVRREAPAEVISETIGKPSMALILLGIVSLFGAIGVGTGMLPTTPGFGLLVTGLAVILGRQVGRHINPRAPIAVALARSMVTPFDRDKQQELALYFWYLRATCMNVAVAMPISVTVWLVTSGTIKAACVAAGSALPTASPVLLGFNATLELAPIGVAVAALVGFVLAVAGGEYHRAWKQARLALDQERVRAHLAAKELAEVARPES